MTKPNKDNNNRIENLEEGLYSRNGGPQRQQATDLHAHQSSDASDDWSDRQEFDRDKKSSYDLNAPYDAENISSFSKWILLISVAFFVLAVGVGALIYFHGTNVISSNNITISVSGPISVGGGQELDQEVTVQNQNNSDLTDATLLVDYPDGTQNPENISQPQLHQSYDLGPIAAGGSATQKISAVFFGEQNSEKDITLTLDYQVKNSTATFQKTKTLPIEITSVPVTVTVSSLTQINSGQQIELDVNVTSNSQNTLQNIMVIGTYPFGFSFGSSVPQPFANSANAAWSIGNLAPGQAKTIKILGTLQGQDGEDRAFQFAVGVQSQQNSIAIDPQFLSATQTISIAKPFIGVDLSLDGSTDSTYTTSVGHVIQGDLSWVSNAPDKITNASITLTFSGSALDKTRVQSDQGFYDSNANTITWNETNDPALATVSPGDTGELNFNFVSLVPQIGNLAAFSNQSIVLSISVNGQRIDSSGVPSQLVSTVTRTVSLDTTLALAPRVAYTDGPFVNAGLIPPQAGKTTTYTIILAVTNTSNDASGVKVTGTLPSYVQWLNQVSPSSQTVTYTPASGAIEWDPGQVPAGTGFSTSPQQVAFQVSVTPSISQVGSLLPLLNGLTLIGTDSFSGDSLTATSNTLTTNTIGDSTYQYNDGIVQPASQ